MDTPQVLDTLQDTPTWLRAGLARVTTAQASVRLQPDEWSLSDIFAHLRASDAILAPRIYHVLIRDEPPLIGFDERLWALVVARASVPLKTLLDAFTARRAELIGVLRTLDETSWDRCGMHEIRGRMSLRVITSDLAEHELQHRAQWEAVLAAHQQGRPLATTDRNTNRVRRPSKST